MLYFHFYSVQEKNVFPWPGLEPTPLAVVARPVTTGAPGKALWPDSYSSYVSLGEPEQIAWV